MLRYTAFLLAAILLSGLGCDSNPGNNQPPDRDARPVSAEDVKRANREAVETDRKYAEQKKEEYRKQLQQKLTELDQQAQRWNEKIQQASGQAKEKLIQQKDEFLKKRDEFAAKLKQLDEAAGPAWKDLKAGLDRSYEDMKEAFNKTREHFK
jgi:molecular chaperone GrpE (heat shock protein)